MFKRLLLIVLIAALLLPLTAQSIGLTEAYCEAAMYNPGYLKACLWFLMMECWDPLDWGDEDTG